MRENSFINHEDPTKALDLSAVSLSEQYTKLTSDEKVLVFLKLKGFTHRPPTIERLYSDEYYLGGEDFFDGGRVIFDFWKEGLKKIVPSEVTTKYPLLCLSGAIGIGKSTVSKLLLANTISRISCMSNPWRTFGLGKKPLSTIIFHRDEDIADKEFRRWILEEVYERSPYFKNLPHNHKIRVLTSGPRGAGGLGTDLIFAILSEVNFWNNEQNTMERVNSTLIRITSRFDIKASLTLAGGMIIDSSAKGASGPTEIFLENADPEFTWNCHPTHWEVRPGMYSRSEGKKFSVYIGDGKYPAQILPEDYRLNFDQDPGKVLEIPIQLLGEAKADLIKTLQDKGGVSTGASDSFFGGSIEHLVNCSTIRNKIPEIIMVDFYNKQDRLITKIEPMISMIPRGTFCVLGLDLGVKSDITGISLSSFNGWEIVNNVKMPKFKCHFIVGISRKEGQQTSLFHIFDLILELKKRLNNNLMVSADQAFSAQILQDCERENIRTNYLSTDNSPCEPSIYLKNVINNELLVLPEHRRLQREAYDLRYTTTRTGKSKIDHPKKATQDPKIFDINNGVGSKDIWDALSQSIYSIKQMVDQGEELGYNASTTMQLESLKGLTKDPREETQKQFQGMLESIF